jgi:hypothetical protein
VPVHCFQQYENPLWRVFLWVLQENKKTRYSMGLENTGQKNLGTSKKCHRGRERKAKTDEKAEFIVNK